MAKIKIEDIEKVENLEEAEQRAIRGTGFAAWLKNRSADGSEADDWADEEADKREVAPDNASDGAPAVKPDSTSE